MSDNGKDDRDKDTKDESITSTHRRRNLISGIDDAHLALAIGGLAAVGLGYVALKPTIDTFIQNMAMARQQTPPPPPAAIGQQATVVAQQPQLAEPTNEYVDEPEAPQVQVPSASENTELGEVDHRNYQTTRRRRPAPSQSQFGTSIAGG